MTRVKCSQLRGKKPAEIQKQLDDLRQELNTLRVGKVTGSGGAQKLGKIRNVRKSIAHVLIVRNQTTKEELRKLYHGKKYKPKDLRRRKTRALRRLLSPKERAVQLKKTQRRQWAFPKHMPRKKQVTFHNSIPGKFIPRNSSASVFPSGAHDNRYNAKIAQFLASSASSANDNELVSTNSPQEISPILSSSIHSNLFHRRIVTMIETLRKPNSDPSLSHTGQKSQPITFGQLKQASVLEEKPISHQLPIHVEGKQQKTLASFVRDNTPDLPPVETAKSSTKDEDDEPKLHYSPSLEKLFEEQSVISQTKPLDDDELDSSRSPTSFYIHPSVLKWSSSPSNQLTTSPPLPFHEQTRTRPPPPSYTLSITNNNRVIRPVVSDRSQSLVRPPTPSSVTLSTVEVFPSISLPCVLPLTNPVRSPPPQYQSPTSTLSSVSNLPPPSPPKPTGSTSSLAGFDREFSRLLYGKEANKIRRRKQKRKAYSDPVKESVEEARRSYDKNHRHGTTHSNETDSDEDDNEDNNDDKNHRITSSRSLNLTAELSFLPRRRRRRQADFLNRNYHSSRKTLVPPNPLLKQRIPSFLRVYSQASSSSDNLLQWHLFNLSDLETFHAMMTRLYKNENLARVQLYEIYRTALLSTLAAKTSSHTDDENRALTTSLKI
ncbi:unnamed protein product [Adineta ricciae]|uniref:Large ribosomal subunit protein uL29 n=1 Tax=Adineta ricciae TaxID=249248 RepID=A0A815YBT4_ADIRI|nr:unnamed protein product [Adineta ricciae]